MDDARWNRLAAAAGMLGLVVLIVGFAAPGSMPKADDTGAQLTKFADLFVIDGDPSTDIGVPADAPPLAVIKAGQVVAGRLPAPA